MLRSNVSGMEENSQIMKKKEDPYLGEILETAAPLALSTSLLNRCTLSTFVILPCYQPLVHPGPVYQLVVPLPCVHTIRLFGCAIIPQHSMRCFRFHRWPFECVPSSSGAGNSFPLEGRRRPGSEVRKTGPVFLFVWGRTWRLSALEEREGGGENYQLWKKGRKEKRITNFGRKRGRRKGLPALERSWNRPYIVLAWGKELQIENFR